MREVTEETITADVLARLDQAKDPRVQQISAALVRHLHAFVREIEPTVQEWAAAIDFLTRTGHMCDDKRQEFILLSDALGVSMLVDAINHRRAGEATESTVLGPFYVQDPPEYALGSDLSEGIDGMPMLITGSVTSAAGGEPLAGAVVDVWQSDSEGFYDVQHLDGLALRGRLHTAADGRFWCWTVRPAAYPIPDDGPVGQMLKAQGRHPFRPAHVHFMISAAGHERLVTHVFAEGDEYLHSDVVFGVKSSLIREFVVREPGIAADGRSMDRPYTHLHYDFSLKSASAD